MDDTKTQKDKEIFKNLNIKSAVKIDTALFDRTLDQIRKMQENLDEKIEPKSDSYINKNVNEENVTNSDEHIIDNNHLRMEELHKFTSKSEVKHKKFFGFYTYLALIIGFVFAIYEVLNIFKFIIISKYPAIEPYIEYFYEVIEILAYIVMNAITFIQNLF